MCLFFHLIRLLVYEYMENDSLQQWLHGYVGQVSPLTWNIRVNIIIGTAKGCAFLSPIAPIFCVKTIYEENFSVFRLPS